MLQWLLNRLSPSHRELLDLHRQVDEIQLDLVDLRDRFKRLQSRELMREARAGKETNVRSVEEAAAILHNAKQTMPVVDTPGYSKFDLWDHLL